MANSQSKIDAAKWQQRFLDIQKQVLQESKKMQDNFFNKKIRVLGVSGSARDEFDMAQDPSTTEWLLEKTLDECQKMGAETKILPLRKYDIKYCKACYSTTNAQCHFKCSCYSEGEKGDDMTNKIYDLCSWADVIIFATPVNNFKISSLMSLFVDRLISMDGSLYPADPQDPKNKELNKLHSQFIATHATDIPGSGFLRRFAGKVGGIIVAGHEEGASMAISSLFMTLNHYGFLFPPFSTMYAIAGVCDETSSDKEKLQIPCHEEDARNVAKNLVTATQVLKRKGDYWWHYKGDLN